MTTNADHSFAVAQALRYAEELRELQVSERLQRKQVVESLVQLQTSYRATVRALAAALDLRDDKTGDHAARVSRLALRLAERVAPRLCDDHELEYGFLLHDVGKIGVRDAILLKPGPLTDDERREMEQHPLYGERIVAQVPYLRGLARAIVLSHHERWDGGGYPAGLVGSGIPLASRIFAVADSFDAMTHDRPYRSAMPAAAALAEIERESGRQFDPNVVAAFVQLASPEAA